MTLLQLKRPLICYILAIISHRFVLLIQRYSYYITSAKRLLTRHLKLLVILCELVPSCTTGLPDSAVAGPAAWCQLQASPSHLMLAESCLAYLLSFERLMPYDELTAQFLGPYAARYWTSHARRAGEVHGATITQLAAELLAPSLPGFPKWLWLDMSRVGAVARNQRCTSASAQQQKQLHPHGASLQVTLPSARWPRCRQAGGAQSQNDPALAASPSGLEWLLPTAIGLAPWAGSRRYNADVAGPRRQLRRPCRNRARRRRQQ